MTVVAYSSKHRVMAADSRFSDNSELGLHVTHGQKIFRLKNGALLGTAGDDDARELMVLLGKATARKMPSREQLAETKTELHGIMVFPKGEVFIIDVRYIERDGDGEWTGIVTPILDDVVAVGHGMEFAYGAMDSGKDPQAAVRAACKRDSTCALPVQWESIDAK
jgi:hypothetical protein